MSQKTERLMRELAASIREDVGDLPTGVKSLGEEIKRARADAHMSLDDVSRASGFTKSHIWEVERGRSLNPTVGMVAALSKALGVPFMRLAQAALKSQDSRPSALAGSSATAPDAGQAESTNPKLKITAALDLDGEVRPLGDGG